MLTGGNGYLGSCLRKNLLKDNEIYTLSRGSSDYNCDLALESPKFNHSFDLVIHSAGKAHSIPVKEVENADFFNVNFNGTLNLLKGLTKPFLPRYFVFISSVSVYGLTFGKNINEETLLLAEDSYGKSKSEAEFIVKKWCDENNVICTILRLPLVVGVNPPGNLGAMIRGIRNGYYFNIGGGHAKKSMVLATDISKFILKAAEVGGTYNLTDGIHPTFNELSKCISRNLDKSFVPNMPLIIANVLAKIGDIIGNAFPINSNKLLKITSTLTFDDSKARISFGWNPTSVLDGFKINEDV